MWCVCFPRVRVPDIASRYIKQIVEELEDRLGDRIDDVLEVVRSSLTEPVPAAPPVDLTNDPSAPAGDDPHPDDATWEDYHANDVVFDDTGEGAGIEGDLDVEED